MNQPIIVHYWRGKGFIGAGVRHSSSGPYDHCALEVTIDGQPVYLQSYPFRGFIVTDVALDPSDAIQETGLEWTPGTLARIIRLMSKVQYSLIGGLLTLFGLRDRTGRKNCADAVLMMLRELGLQVDALQDPNAVSIEIERVTGHPVRIKFGKPNPISQPKEA